MFIRTTEDLIHGCVFLSNNLFINYYVSRDMTKQQNSVRPAKTQICQGIRPVWSDSSLSAWRNLGSLATHWAHSEDSGQTGRVPRLIWVFAGRTFILLVLSCRGSCLFRTQSVARYRKKKEKDTLWWNNDTNSWPICKRLAEWDKENTSWYTKPGK